MAERDALERRLGELVRVIGWSSERIGHSFAASQDLHPTDLRALTAIYRSNRSGVPLTSRQLATELDLSSAAVTYVLDRLERSGHVWRERDRGDRRRIVLRFAEHGRDVATSFFTPLRAAHGRALAAYSDADLELCIRLLDDVALALERFDDGLRRAEPDPSASP